MATLGVLLIWFGWFGFNGGSTLSLNEQIPHILVNTLLAGASGLVGSILASYWLYQRFEVGLLLNGPLAGLASITAGAHAVTAANAVLIGFVGSLCMVGAFSLLIRLRIDDAVGAIPVHLAGGIWGSLAVGLFGQLDVLGTALSRGSQIGMQLLGIVVSGMWAFGFSFVVLKLVNQFWPLRVSAEDEHVGLNISEHGASTELLSMFRIMEDQSDTGDLGLRVPIEPFTQVGQIAERYNEVMASLELTVAQRTALVNTARDGIITLSANERRITSVNPVAEEMLGYDDVSQLVGGTLAKIFYFSNDKKAPTFAEVLATPTYLEVVGQRADGSIFPMEIAFTQVGLKDGSFFYACLFHDVTARKALLDELTMARNQAMEASELKTRLLATVSHELRTPINAISGLAEMLMLGYVGGVSAEQEETLKRIVGNSAHLESLVSDLIDQAQLDAGMLRLHRSVVSPQELLDHIVFSIEILATVKGLSFEKYLDPTLPAVLYEDDRRLKQIAVNLIANSIKYTHAGSVKISFLTVGMEHWMMEVSDTGRGISLVDQEKVFESFQQVDSSPTREYQGAGLGLSIVSQLVDIMEGRVVLESEVDEGSVFQVVLPLRVTSSVEEFYE